MVLGTAGPFDGFLPSCDLSEEAGCIHPHPQRAFHMVFILGSWQIQDGAHKCLNLAERGIRTESYAIESLRNFERHYF